MTNEPLRDVLLDNKQTVYGVPDEITDEEVKDAYAARPEGFNIIEDAVEEAEAWEQCVDAGDDVQEGQLLGRIHYPENPQQPPEEYYAHRDGYVIATRAITPTRPGDVVVVLFRY